MFWCTHFHEAAARSVGIGNIFDGEMLRHDLQAGLTWLQVADKNLAFTLGSKLGTGESAVRRSARQSKLRARHGANLAAAGR